MTGFKFSCPSPFQKASLGIWGSDVSSPAGPPNAFWCILSSTDLVILIHPLSPMCRHDFSPFYLFSGRLNAEWNISTDKTKYCRKILRGDSSFRPCGFNTAGAAAHLASAVPTLMSHRKEAGPPPVPLLHRQYNRRWFVNNRSERRTPFITVDNTQNRQ